ncbi:MAG: class I SAM-dependent methyltransferase [Candidatus Taylorbacteria bacterium]|nr:class I SAM-dependent methyltransferase [Candidatus Taylorbacteria bacterium]
MQSRYTNIIDEVYRTFGKFADAYEVDRKRFAFSLKLLDEQHVIRGMRVLDVGCGIGIFALALSKLGAEVTGVDKFIFPHAVENPYKIKEFEALKRIWEKNGLRIIEGDVLAPLPFRDGEFDLINCDATIEHLPYSPKSLFGEVKRVLRPGGIFLVTTPNFANLLRRVRFLFGRSPQWDIKEYFDSGKDFTGHRREFTVQELSSQLSWSGFDVCARYTRNSLFQWHRMFHPRKWIAQWFVFLSFPFPSTREMIFILARTASK